MRFCFKLQGILGLPTEETNSSTPDGPRVFKENDTAQLFITAYLQAKKHKIKKDSVDVLDDLKEYFSTLDPSSSERSTLEKHFEKVVPRETEAYKERKRQREEKVKEATEKKEAAEKKKAETIEKKRKLLEEEQKKAEAAAAAAAATTGTGGGATSTSAAGGGDPSATAAAAAAAAEVSALDPNNPNAEYHLNYSSHSIGDQADSGKGRRAKHQAVALNAPIVKTLVKLDGIKVVVHYTRPGAQWVQAIHARLGNISAAVLVAHQEIPELLNPCLASFLNNKITSKIGRVVLAVMLHVAAKSDSELEGIGLAGNFFEKNFIKDLQNTKSLWLSPMFAGSMVHFHCLFELTVEPNLIGGLTAEDRAQRFTNLLGNKNLFALEKGKQVAQIVDLLKKVSKEIEDKKLGEAEKPLDPFETVSTITAAK